MTVWQFDLLLHSPVLIAGVAGGDENSENGAPYIPGSVVRGALVSRR